MPRRCLLPLSMLLAVLLPAGCGSVPKPPPEVVDELYRAGVEDARVAEPEEVVDTLVPILPTTPGLPWRVEGEARWVLVTAWAEADRLPREGAATLSEDLRVTPGRSLRSFCRPIDTSPAELRLRLEGRLGLPPGSGADRRMVELWVPPDDLFRACPDPDVSSTRCDLGYPPDVAPEHRRWLDARRDRTYEDEPPPSIWTRLGYTYDWADPFSEVGESEYVVRRGAEVEVAGSFDTEEYCERERSDRRREDGEEG